MYEPSYGGITKLAAKMSSDRYGTVSVLFVMCAQSSQEHYFSYNIIVTKNNCMRITHEQITRGLLPKITNIFTSVNFLTHIQGK